ncbi:HTH-type transcriptional regulator GbpR [Pigmentiphaga humi]|uniref:HTH-type transcriptional regulator GbpR n=2 Tax=Pigmentiphaga humi TaxID=2478468 RepID=A0A3P4B343_9BURK|nr:HTH-type transcriptional regulator GbpR [Pigmentiphaga humi]
MNSRSVNKKVMPKQGPRSEALLIERFFSRRLRLSQVRVLVAIASAGQLKLVAEEMNVTPAAVSKQISEMEDALKHPILQRSGNGVVLTELGHLLARRGRELLDQLDRTRVEVEAMCTGQAGRIGIGAGYSLSALIFPALAFTLKRQTPNVTLSLKEGTFSYLAPMLADSTIDLVVARYTTHRLISSFRQQTIFQDPMVVVCSAHHPLAAKSDVGWADLEGLPWILPEAGSPNREYLERDLAQHGLTVPPGCVESQTWTMNLELLTIYPFLAMLPLTLTRKYRFVTPMRVLPVSMEAGLGAVKAVWREDSDDVLVDLALQTLHRNARDAWNDVGIVQQSQPGR